jgi:hypothetical protein
MTTPHCCYAGGPRHPAEWEITDEGELRPDLAVTHACSAHLADMISSIPPTKPVGPWTVRRLDGMATLPAASGVSETARAGTDG